MMIMFFMRWQNINFFLKNRDIFVTLLIFNQSLCCFLTFSIKFSNFSWKRRRFLHLFDEIMYWTKQLLSNKFQWYSFHLITFHETSIKFRHKTNSFLTLFSKFLMTRFQFFFTFFFLICSFDDIQLIFHQI